MDEQVQQTNDDRSTCEAGGMCALMGQAFRGALGWTAKLSVLYILVFAAIAVVAVVRFCRADDAKQWIFWAAIFLAAWGTTMTLKMWIWHVMIRESIFNRLDRLERRLAELRGPADD